MSYENGTVRRTNRVFGSILHKNQKIPRAASKVSAGRMRPAGRRLPTPGLEYQYSVHISPFHLHFNYQDAITPQNIA